MPHSHSRQRLDLATWQLTYNRYDVETHRERETASNSDCGAKDLEIQKRDIVSRWATEPIIGHLSGISRFADRESGENWKICKYLSWHGAFLEIQRVVTKCTGLQAGGVGATGAVPIALKLYTSSHCQTNCGRCMSNVSLRNVEYGNCMCEVLPSVPVPSPVLSLPPL